MKAQIWGLVKPNIDNDKSDRRVSYFMDSQENVYDGQPYI